MEEMAGMRFPIRLQMEELEAMGEMGAMGVLAGAGAAAALTEQPAVAAALHKW